MKEWFLCLHDDTQFTIFLFIFIVIVAPILAIWLEMRCDDRWIPNKWYEWICCPVAYIFIITFLCYVLYTVGFSVYDIIKCIICPEC